MKKRNIYDLYILVVELEEGNEWTKESFSFSFLDRPLCLLFLTLPTSSTKPIKSLSSLLSTSNLLLNLLLLLGEAQPKEPVWDPLVLHLLLDPFCSKPPSSGISSRSARRVLDFLEGDGERRRSSRRGRKLVEDLSERLDGVDGVSFGDEGIRSRDSWGGRDSGSIEYVILDKREADFAWVFEFDLWEGGVVSIFLVL